MAWTTQHVFTTGERVRAAWVKSMQDNLLALEHPASVYSRRYDDASTPTNSTTSASFTNASANYLQATFTLATARSVMLFANIVAYTSAGGTEGEIGISIDGVDESGGHGLALVEWMDQPILFPLSYIANGLSAGEHVFRVRYRRTAGTGTINIYASSRHWFYAVEI